MTGNWVIRVHAQHGIFFVLGRLGRNFFTNFRPQGVKMADDRTGSVRDVYSKLLCQSIPIDEPVFVWLSIDHRLTDTNRYQLTNLID